MLEGNPVTLRGGSCLADDTETVTAEVLLDVTDIRFHKVVLSRSEYCVEKVTNTRFIVRKGKSVYYVGLERGKAIMASCNCPDWLYHSRRMMVPCKHIWLVAESERLVSFPKDLPPLPATERGTKDENKKGKAVPVRDGEAQKGDGPDDWTVD